MDNENLNQLPEDVGIEEKYRDVPESIEEIKKEDNSSEEVIPGVPESEREVSDLPEEKGEETKLLLPDDEGEVAEYEDLSEPQNEENNSEDLEKLEEDEGIFDLSACELDARGVPVLSAKDLDNITYYSSFVGMPPEQMMTNIKNLYKEINDYFEYMSLPEDQRDPSLAYIYNEDNFKSTIEVLGKFQLEARSQNLNELDTASFTSMIENANVSQLFLTSLCVNNIFNKENNNDILDSDLSLGDNLKNENYYTIFVKELKNRIDKSDILTKPDKLLSNEPYDKNIKKFNEIYQLMFNHIGNRYAYNANSQTNKILDSIFNIVIEYWNRITRYAYMNDPEYRVAYSKMIAKEVNVPDEKLDEFISDKMQRIEEILKKDLLYYSLKNHSDENKLIAKSIVLSKRMYNLAEKITDEFSNKEFFIGYLKENCISLDKFLNLVYEKYGIELKKEVVDIENALQEENNEEKTNINENEKSPLSQLEEIISSEIRKYEIAPDKKTNFDLEEIERSVDGAPTNKVEDASSEFEKYQKMQEEKAGPQAKRDKYSARNYPFLESAKFATGSLKNIVSYVSNSDKINYAMQLLNELIANYITTEIYKVLDQSGIMRRDHSDFLVSNIDLKTPIKDLDEKVFDESRRNNPYKSITSKYQTDICGSYLDELSACITVTETCADSDEMLKDICLYYGVNESSVSSFEQIRSLDLFYRHNNINQIRYTVFDTILSIYDKMITDIDIMTAQGNDVLKDRMLELSKLEEEREKMIQERIRMRQNKKNKKKRKS